MRAVYAATLMMLASFRRYAMIDFSIIYCSLLFAITPYIARPLRRALRCVAIATFFMMPAAAVFLSPCCRYVLCLMMLRCRAAAIVMLRAMLRFADAAGAPMLIRR